MRPLREILSADAARRTIRTVCRRFPFPLAFAVLLTAWEIISLFEWSEAFDVYFRSVNWALAEGFLLTLAVNLWCEFGGKSKYLRAALLAAVAIAVADCAVLVARGGTGGIAETVGRSAFVAALVTAILFLPAIRGYSRSRLWTYTLAQFGAVATAVCLGIVMAVACMIISGTLNVLFGIFNYKFTISAVCVFAWLLPCVVYLSTIPRPRLIQSDMLPERTVVGAFCKNVVLPLALLYTLILYVYAAKILFTWTLPNASVTWMVTGLMITVLVMLYGMQRYAFGGVFSDSAILVSSLARRWMPVLLLPLLVLMSVGLIYRLREYGITVSRLYVAAFNVWAFATVIYLIARRNANLNIIAASFSLVFALLSMIPGLNLTSITTRIIRSEVITALHNAGADRLPLTKAEVGEVLGKIGGTEARNLASKIAYLDDWNNHSDIADIVKSDTRLFEFELIPDTSEVVDEVVVYEIDCEDSVPVPAGYGKVAHFAKYNIELKNIDGYADMPVGDYAVRLPLDSLRKAGDGSGPLTMDAVNLGGDSAKVVFTRLLIDGKSAKPIIRRADYFLFTK